MSQTSKAFRADFIDFVGDPAEMGAAALRHMVDGAMIVADGKVQAFGPASRVLNEFSGPVHDYRGHWILPGMVDTHVHYPQTDVIASYGEKLLTWLERYTFPTEAKFADLAHARPAAELFLDLLLSHGTTTAAVFCTVHPQSVDAFFESAQKRRLRMVAGKVLMDRNCPEWLRDTAQTGYDQSKALIEHWHGRDRLSYAVTPRFAPTSTPDQLQAAGSLMREFSGLYLQTHVAENTDEIAWVRELFPQARSYLDVYDRFGLLHPKSIFAHCIHLDADDLQTMAERDAVMSFCPTSNTFLGSGLFSVAAAHKHGIRVGLATDVGGGTSFSMLQTMAEAYKVSQLRSEALTATQAYYWATLGGAKSLQLDEHIGNFQLGKEADFIVVNPKSTPLLAHRMQHCETLEEALFLLMMLGDDRAIARTYILGDEIYRRPN